MQSHLAFGIVATLSVGCTERSAPGPITAPTPATDPEARGALISVEHAGSFDVAFLGCLPGFVIMAAADEAELAHMIATAAAIDDRPSAVRYPRGDGFGVAMPEAGVPLEIGKGRIVRRGEKICLAAVRVSIRSARHALRILGRDGRKHASPNSGWPR